jgi:peptide-methionine (S)-S-oxide reductase
MTTRFLTTTVLALAIAGGLFTVGRALAHSDPVALPDPKTDIAPATMKPQVAVFEHVKGVTAVSSGYSGGSATTANYSMVGTGLTGHAESVKVVYDPSKVSYGQLLKVYFSVAHDPTQLNRQGPDSGTQYRSAIFFADATQKTIASAYIQQLTAAHSFGKPIVTQVVPLKAFYPAEAYHQDYARLHPDDAYIVYNDAPKVVALKSLLPSLYVVR